MNLKSFIQIVRHRTGLNFEKNCPLVLSDAVRKSMAEKGYASSEQYYQLIVADTKEFDRFINLLTINETYFFREPDHIRLFSEKLVPEILSRLPVDRKIRIFSAGCSTGEEPYTLAMSLYNKYGSACANLFEIMAADIDTDVLEIAAKGIFRDHSFRTIDEDMKKTYFDYREKDIFQIKPFIRERVQFFSLNLMDEPYPDIMQNIDFIFYRNVSIYFSPQTQLAILKNLSSVLNEQAYLIVGATETLSHDLNILNLIEMDGLFLYRKKRADEPSQVESGQIKTTDCLPEKISGTFNCTEKTSLTDILNIQKEELSKKNIPAPKKPVEDSKPVNLDRAFDDALTHMKEKEYQKALDILDSIIEKDSSQIRASAMKAGILINMKNMEEAKRICLEALKKDSLCIECYFHLGMIEWHEGNDEKAMRRFKEVLYIKSSSWLAHYYLARLYQNRGDCTQALREYQIVMKLIEDGYFPEHGIGYFPLPFSSDQIMRLCRQQAKQNGKRCN